MKKICLFACSFVITNFVVAQKIDASKVPAVVKDSFEKKYPGTIAKWEKENGNYEVNFKSNNSEMSMLISNGGNILETETSIGNNELPGTALAYLKEHYKGKTVKEAAKIVKADNTIVYEAEINNTDILFDANGKFLKEEKEKD